MSKYIKNKKSFVQFTQTKESRAKRGNPSASALYIRINKTLRTDGVSLT